MKKILLASAMAIASLSAHAAVPVPKFNTLPDFSLACESAVYAFDLKKWVYYHAWLDVLPSQNMVRLTNKKGETFDFPVTKATVTIGESLNEFGNIVTFAYPLLIDFKDQGNSIRSLVQQSSPRSLVSYAYTGLGANGRWSYACIIAPKEDKS